MEPTDFFPRGPRSIRLLSTTEDIDCDLLTLANQRFQELTSTVEQSEAPEVSAVQAKGLPVDDCVKQKRKKRILSLSKEKRHICLKNDSLSASVEMTAPPWNCSKRRDRKNLRSSTPVNFSARVPEDVRTGSFGETPYKRLPRGTEADYDSVHTFFQAPEPLGEVGREAYRENNMKPEQELKQSERTIRKPRRHARRQRRRKKSLFELPTGSHFDLLIETGKFEKFMARATRA